jgi:hypothetical protein
LGTFKRRNKTAINTPVRLFPVVQCMKTAGGESEIFALAIICLNTLAITSFPETNISINAATISYP